MCDIEFNGIPFDVRIKMFLHPVALMMLGELVLVENNGKIFEAYFPALFQSEYGLLETPVSKTESEKEYNAYYFPGRVMEVIAWIDSELPGFKIQEVPKETPVSVKYSNDSTGSWTIGDWEIVAEKISEETDDRIQLDCGFPVGMFRGDKWNPYPVGTKLKIECRLQFFSTKDLIFVEGQYL
jgi:hypothetical protein